MSGMHVLRGFESEFKQGERRGSFKAYKDYQKLLTNFQGNGDTATFGPSSPTGVYMDQEIEE